MDKPITINLPVTLDDSIRDLAKQRLVSKSALIRMVLADHVEVQAAKGQPQPEEAASV
jgi:predicted transcriptional regulator